MCLKFQFMLWLLFKSTFENFVSTVSVCESHPVCRDSKKVLKKIKSKYSKVKILFSKDTYKKDKNRTKFS